MSRRIHFIAMSIALLLGTLSQSACIDVAKDEQIQLHEIALRERVMSPLPPKVRLGLARTAAPLVFEISVDLKSGSVLEVVELLDQGQPPEPALRSSLEKLRFRVSDISLKGRMVGRLTFYPVRMPDGTVLLRNPVGIGLAVSRDRGVTAE